MSGWATVRCAYNYQVFSVARGLQYCELQFCYNPRSLQLKSCMVLEGHDCEVDWDTASSALSFRQITLA